MPVMRMPSGDYVDIADGASPQVIAKVMSQYPATAASRAADAAANAPPPTSPTPRDSTQDVDTNIPILSDISRIGSSAIHSATFHGDDLLTAAAQAGLAGLSGQDAGKAFQDAKAKLAQYRSDMQAYHPIEGTVGDIAGMFAAPEDLIGQGAAKLGAAATKYAPTVASKAAQLLDNPVTNLASRFAGTTIGKGTQAGLEYGTLAGAADAAGGDNFLGDTANGAIQGALEGTVGGGAANALGWAGKLVRDRMPSNIPNVAHDYIARALESSVNPTTGKPWTMENVKSNLGDAVASGATPTVADVSPNLQGANADLAAKPDIAGSVIKNAAAARMASAPDRLNTQVNNVFGLSSDDPSAFGLKSAIKADRQAGATDPATGFDAMLDPKNNVWSPELDDIFSAKTPAINDALRQAVRVIRNDQQDPYQLVPLLKKAGIDPASVGVHEPTGGAPTPEPQMPSVGTNIGTGGTAQGLPTPPTPPMQQVPSMYAIDATRRAINMNANQAFATSNPDATGIANMAKALKNAATDAHPGYGNLLAGQQNLFERAKSVEQGQKFVNSMNSGQAEQWLADAQNARVHPDDLKVGVGDAMRNMTAQQLQAITRTPAQQAALAHVVGDPGKVSNFSDFLNNEIRSNQTDVATLGLPKGALNPVSPTDNPSSYVVSETAKGLPFGKFSAGYRMTGALKTLAGSGPNLATRKALAAILTSGGKDLPAGMTQAAAYRAAQAAYRARMASILGRSVASIPSLGQ
jgi:hypothetical protein